MRLLIVSAYFDSHRGGIEIVAGQLAREFSRAGEDVVWLASGTECSASHAACGRAPVPVFNGIERALGIPFPIPAPAALATIRREVAAADVVMLHDSLYPTNIAAFLVARWLGKPVAITQHIGNVPYRNPILRCLMQVMTHLVTRAMLAAADQVVFISRITARAFAGVRYRRPPRLIFNGVNADIFRPPASACERQTARRQFGLPPDRPVALFVGRFVEKKGLHILQRAAQLGGGVTWAFAGWGKLDPRQWGLPNVRVFSGLSEASLVPLYWASDVFVLPSTGEGFPLVLQEAMACGLPAVCGAETAEADDRLAPLLHAIPVGDIDETAKHLLSAVHETIAEHRANRTEQIRAWYSWSHAMQLYLDLFGEMTRERVAARGAAASRVLSTAGMDR